MHGLEWAFSAILAIVFLVTGVNKLFYYETAKRLLTWPGDLPRALVRVIGILEILGAIGLILPAATGIYPALTLFAAVGLALLMFMAASFHAARRETDQVLICVLILALLLVVIYARRGLLPF